MNILQVLNCYGDYDLSRVEAYSWEKKEVSNIGEVQKIKDELEKRGKLSLSVEEFEAVRVIKDRNRVDAGEVFRKYGVLASGGKELGFIELYREAYPKFLFVLRRLGYETPEQIREGKKRYYKEKLLVDEEMNEESIHALYTLMRAGEDKAKYLLGQMALRKMKDDGEVDIESLMGGVNLSASPPVDEDDDSDEDEIDIKI